MAAGKIDILVAQTPNLLQFNGGGTQYIIQTPSGVLYMVYVDTASDISFRKSSDGGFAWSNPTVISGAITATQLSVWYDRWSGLNTDLIHVVWSESAADAVTYRSIDAGNNDTLSATAIVYAGASTAAGGALSITRARGGNIGVAYMIDAGAERGFAKSTNGGTSFASSANPTEATQDQWILLPGWDADDQDLMMFFWDASANEISRKLYDDSANTWSETSIATGMTDLIAATAFPSFAATVDITNSQNILIAWSAVDTLNADLRCWTITETSITETTNIVQNSVDDQGLCSIAINTSNNAWYAYYAGKSDGSETFPTTLNIYRKISHDSGTTWSSEELITDPTINYTIRWLCSIPRFTGTNCVAFLNDQTLDELLVNVFFPVSTGRIVIT